MGGLKPVGLVVGLLGNALVAYAIFSILSATGCTGSVSTCNGAVFQSVWALPVGIILSVVGIFIGGGFIAFTGLFLGIGLGSIAAAAFTDMGMMQSFGWMFGGGFVFFGLLPLLLMMGGRKVAERKQADAMELIRTGVKGVGTITDVRDTGITINDNPRVEIRMRIEPIDGGAAVERSKTVTVSRVSIPRVGERFPAWFDRDDPSKWAFGMDMEANAPPEIKEMFARAQGTPAAPDAPDSPVQELARLTELWKAGALTDREFGDAKARLLSQIGR